MSIADKLNALKKQPEVSARETLPDGLLSISDGVWEATLYRMGYDPIQFTNHTLDSRSSILNNLESDGI